MTSMDGGVEHTYDQAMALEDTLPCMVRALESLCRHHEAEVGLGLGLGLGLGESMPSS